MSSIKENLRVQWTGTNFPEIYGWLIEGSVTRDLTLRILEPGNRNSPIEIRIEEIKLRLNIGDWITRDDLGIFYVTPNQLI